MSKHLSTSSEKVGRLLMTGGAIGALPLIAPLVDAQDAIEPVAPLQRVDPHRALTNADLAAVRQWLEQYDEAG